MLRILIVKSLNSENRSEKDTAKYKRNFNLLLNQKEDIIYYFMLNTNVLWMKYFFCYSRRDVSFVVQEVDIILYLCLQVIRKPSYY